MEHDERNLTTILIACFITLAAVIAEAGAENAAIPATKSDARGSLSSHVSPPSKVSPFDQSNAKSDLETTTAIRKALVSSDRFSRAAKNIQIVTTSDGTVYLSGNLLDAAELQDVLNAAKKAAPGAVVVNRLEVRPPQ